MELEGKTHEQLAWHHLVFASSVSKVCIERERTDVFIFMFVFLWRSLRVVLRIHTKFYAPECNFNSPLHSIYYSRDFLSFLFSSKHPEKPKGMLDMTQKIWAKEGIPGFYRVRTQEMRGGGVEKNTERPGQAILLQHNCTFRLLGPRHKSVSHSSRSRNYSDLLRNHPTIFEKIFDIERNTQFNYRCSSLLCGIFIMKRG